MSGLSESMIFSYLVDAAIAIDPFNDLLTGSDEEEDPESPEGIAAESALQDIELAAKHWGELSSGSGEWARRACAYLSARCCALRCDYHEATQYYREYTSWYTGEDANRALGVTMAVQMEFHKVDLPRELRDAMAPARSVYIVAQHLQTVGELENAIQLINWLLSRDDDLSLRYGQRNRFRKALEKWEAEKA